MTRDDLIFEKIKIWIKYRIDDNFKVKVKDNSFFMRMLGTLLFFNKSFKTYTTTIGSTVYFPADKFNSGLMWPTLAHEAIHIMSAKKYTKPLYFFLYLFPQSLAPFAFLALLAIWFSNWWLLCLLFLLCLAPLPAYFRYRDELKAYIMSLFVVWHRYNLKEISDRNIEHVAQKFYTSHYYWMWPFKKKVKEQIILAVGQIMYGELDDVYPYSKVKEIIGSTN